MSLFLINDIAHYTAIGRLIQLLCHMSLVMLGLHTPQKKKNQGQKLIKMLVGSDAHLFIKKIALKQSTQMPFPAKILGQSFIWVSILISS